MPSARNALQNILTRAPYHRHWWVNDPDCLLVRPDTELSLAEVQSLATAIGLTGGSLLVSDDLPKLPKDRLRIAQVLLPVIDQRPHICDLFENHTPSLIRLDLENTLGAWYLLAIFNWQGRPVSLTFFSEKFNLQIDQTYWWREFWLGETGKMENTSPLVFDNVPPHGVRSIAVRPFKADQPTYLGSNIHLSQGLEVGEWQVAEKQISLRLELGRQANGCLSIYLPWKPREARLNKQPIPFQNLGKGIYHFELLDANGKRLNILG